LNHHPDLSDPKRLFPASTPSVLLPMPVRCRLSARRMLKKRWNFVRLSLVVHDHLYLKTKIVNAFKAFAVHPPWRQPVHIRLK